MSRAVRKEPLENMLEYQNRDLNRIRQAEKLDDRTFFEKEWAYGISTDLLHSEPGEFETLVIDVNVALDMITGNIRNDGKTDEFTFPSNAVGMVEAAKQAGKDLYYPDYTAEKAGEVIMDTGSYVLRDNMEDVLGWLSYEAEELPMIETEQDYEERLLQSIPFEEDIAIASYSGSLHEKLGEWSVPVATPTRLEEYLEEL